MSEVEAAARAHARGVLAGDPGVRADLVPDAEVEPADLFDRLLGGAFRSFELVAHARIGAHHIFKTRYEGATILIVQARWVLSPGGRWQVHEAQLVRVAVEEGV